MERDFEYNGYRVVMTLNTYPTKFSFSYQVTDIQTGLVISQLGSPLEEHSLLGAFNYALFAENEVIRKIDAYIDDK